MSAPKFEDVPVSDEWKYNYNCDCEDCLENYDCDCDDEEGVEICARCKAVEAKKTKNAKKAKKAKKASKPVSTTAK